MQIDIKVEPESLSANLWHLASALPIVMVIGGIQVMLSDSPAWWDAAYADLRDTDVADIVSGIAAAIGLLLLSRISSHWWRALSTDWVYKAFAAISPSPRSIWLLSTFAAVSEELLFRAVLTPIVGVTGSAALFAAMHFGLLLFAPTKAAASRVAVDLLVFGLAMGLLYESAGLIACIIAHLLYNVLAFHISRPAWERAHDEWRKRQAILVGA